MSSVRNRSPPSPPGPGAAGAGLIGSWCGLELAGPGAGSRRGARCPRRSARGAGAHPLLTRRSRRPRRARRGVGAAAPPGQSARGPRRRSGPQAQALDGARRRRPRSYENANGAARSARRSGSLVRSAAPAIIQPAAPSPQSPPGFPQPRSRSRSPAIRDLRPGPPPRGARSPAGPATTSSSGAAPVRPVAASRGQARASAPHHHGNAAARRTAREARGARGYGSGRLAGACARGRRAHLRARQSSPRSRTTNGATTRPLSPPP